MAYGIGVITMVEGIEQVKSKFLRQNLVTVTLVQSCYGASIGATRQEHRHRSVAPRMLVCVSAYRPFSIRANRCILCVRLAMLVADVGCRLAVL